MIYEQITIEKIKYDQLLKDSLELIEIKKTLKRYKTIERLLMELAKEFKSND